MSDQPTIAQVISTLEEQIKIVTDRTTRELLGHPIFGTRAQQKMKELHEELHRLTSQVSDKSSAFYHRQIECVTTTILVLGSSIEVKISVRHS